MGSFSVIWWMGTNSTQLNPTGSKTHYINELCNGFNSKQLMVYNNDICSGNVLFF